MASCYNKGWQHEIHFADHVQSICETSDNTFTVTLKTKRGDICVHIWEGNHHRMQQESMLNCNKHTYSHLWPQVIYNCTSNLGMVCRKAYDRPDKKGGFYKTIVLYNYYGDFI